MKQTRLEKLFKQSVGKGYTHVLQLNQRYVTPWFEHGYICVLCGRRFLGSDIKQARKASDLYACKNTTHMELTPTSTQSTEENPELIK